MQRPCFALAVLLGWMVASVLVVGKANSQPIGTAQVGLAGPAPVHGGLVEAWVIGMVLGQSGGASDVCGDDVGSDFAASDDGNRRGTGTSLAHRPAGNGSQSYWFITVATGYDPAYDFAMLEGRYLNVLPSRTDIEHSMVIEHSGEMEQLTDADLAEAPEGNNSTDVLSCEDFDYWLEGERPTEWSTAINDSNPPKRPTALATAANSNWPFDACWPVAISRTSNDTLMYAEWLGDAQRTICDWWTALRTQPSVVRIRAALEQVEFPDERAWQPVDVAEGTLGADFSTAPSIPEFSEEVLLISAADSLERLSSALQITAQRLRCLAADRIVAQGERRNVAQK